MRLLEKFWLSAGNNPVAVMAAFFVLGLALALASAVLNLHSVTFSGTAVGIPVLGLDPGVSKQVGYILAPNWGIAGLILLPAAIFFLLQARGHLEPLLDQLHSKGMLASTDGGDVDLEKLREDWRRDTRLFLGMALFVFLLSASFTVYDYYVVVLKWLVEDEATLRAILRPPPPAPPVTLGHPLYEFDWSIASIFNDSATGRTANAVFATAAYLIIPLLGAGMLFAGFCWFFSVSSFYNHSRLKRNGVVIVPDLTSVDKRAGFEIFEPMFDALLKSGVFTAILALGMHLQNVYLRAPSEPNIFHMIFGGLDDVIAPMASGNFEPALQYAVRIDKALDIEVSSISFQTYISAIVLALLVFIVIFSVWHYLRANAIEGRNWIRENRDLTEDQLQKLKKMNIWPIGWISLNVLMISVPLLLVSMVYVNFLGLLIFAAALWAIGRLLNAARKSLRSGDE